MDEIRAIRGGAVGHTAAVLDAWDRHRRWSVAADVARRRIERRRLLVLVLLVVGAVAGAAGSQTGWPRPVTGSAAGVASLALASWMLKPLRTSSVRADEFEAATAATR